MIKKTLLAALVVATSLNVQVFANTTMNVPSVEPTVTADDVTTTTNSAVDSTATSSAPANIVENAEQVVQETTGDVQATQEIAKQEGDSLIVTEAWARMPAEPNNNSAIYMTVTNPTKNQVTIVGASASVVANNVELHNSFVDEKGVSRMTSMNKIVIPAETSITLAPGGMHIMLFDLKKKLTEGDKFEVTLQLENAEPIISEVIVMNQ
ncbi:MAG: copper chaperone PCu(A)C [Rickettsiaceae bacterium]|nr:copper chaperone PCu(A)C [Rickettsiaceae bacterium]